MSEQDDATKPIPWIEDGHILHFRLDKDQLYISHVECPHSDSVSICTRMRDWCVVGMFIGVYGTELNLGNTYVDGPLEIAWIPIPGVSDLDKEFAQVWFIPVSDPDFRAAKILNQGENPVE